LSQKNFFDPLIDAGPRGPNFPFASPLQDGLDLRITAYCGDDPGDETFRALAGICQFPRECRRLATAEGTAAQSLFYR
jgi:hypothetical protein